MARPLWIEYPGAVYHVTSRDNVKINICENDQDRKTLLNLLSDRAASTALWVFRVMCERTLVTLNQVSEATGLKKLIESGFGL